MNERTLAIFESYAPPSLVAASNVCHAWLDICVPEMYRSISARSSRAEELIKDLSKPGSRVVQYAEELKIRGPIPWLALPRLLVSLPHLGNLNIIEDKKASPTVYLPRHPRLACRMYRASRTTLALTSLFLANQWFSSTADILWLLACLPHLASAHFNSCNIQTASTTAPLVPVTHLKSLSLSYNEDAIHEGILSSLAQWWQWPHAIAGPAITPYPGLHREEAQDVLAVIRAITLTTLKGNL